MSKQKPSIPKGTRDFGPAEMAKRNFIFNHIREVYRKYGYQQLETPSMENLSVLTGKYGDEGDQLLFKILNSGDFLSKTEIADYQNGSAAILPKIAEKGLRYDLTVPFARYVVMNQNDLTFPFRRFQIQPVWRADRPQKGRYREFYQCDADVVGTESLICEAEIILMLKEVFANLKIEDYTIHVNNRKILRGIIESIDEEELEGEIISKLDKLDKIGSDKVLSEISDLGVSDNGIEMLNKIILMANNQLSIEDMVNQLRDRLVYSNTGTQGVNEIEKVFDYVKFLGENHSKLKFDITLARGLSYYTGAIFEVKANNVSLSSSISGGGRYDNLTGVFGMPGMSGVGISFGVDRIYDVMEELELFPEESLASTQVLLISFDEETEKHALSLLSKLRKAGVSAEIYPDQVKLKKQFAYADKKGIAYTLVVGTEEMQKQAYGLKNLKSGVQELLSLEEIISRLQQ